MVKVNEQYGQAMSFFFRLSDSSLLVIWVVVIVHPLLCIPRTCDQPVSLTIFIIWIRLTPINDRGDVFDLLVNMLIRLAELLHLGTIFDIYAVHSASLVSNKQLSMSLVHAYTGDFFFGDVSKD
jgi:hypothetical protein